MLFTMLIASVPSFFFLWLNFNLPGTLFSHALIFYDLLNVFLLLFFLCVCCRSEIVQFAVVTCVRFIVADII